MKTKNILLGCVASLSIFASVAYAEAMFGAGAAFPNPVYQAWGKAYQAQTGSALVYTPVGSGKGIAEITAARVDFGASDKPLKPEELEKSKLMQFPTVIGGIVPTVNIRGIANGQLLLDANTLAEIYLGKITRWNDPALLALNPGLALPDANIAVIHRSDKSGTTFNLTNYLSKVSPEWKAAVGEGLTVEWKTGEGVERLDGMAKKLANTPNSIGYLDMADLQKMNLTYVRMKNREGVAITPSAQSFAAAAVSAKWSPSNNFFEILTDEPGKDSWPITAATFILLERTSSDAGHIAEVLKFFDWAYRSGQQIADNLHYVPLPANVVEGIRSAWKSQIKNSAGKPLWQ